MRSFLSRTSRSRILKILGILTIVLLCGHLIFTVCFTRQHGDAEFYETRRKSTSVLSSSAISKFVTIISQVGEYHLTIEGYTSPFALVELSTGLFTVTELRTADETGYFKFNNILLHSALSREPCLVSTDKNGVSTPLLCLSEFPKGQDVFIRDIILAPSLILEKSQVQTGQTTKASGFTIPNCQVDLFLFREEKKRFWLNWIKPAEAKGAPRFTLKSNHYGYYEFNLPSYLPTDYRLFVGTIFKDSPSPKSNTLKFKILNFWEMIILSIYNLLYLLWLWLKNLFSNPLFLFLLEIGIIILLIFLLKRRKKSLALIKYQKKEVVTRKNG